MIECKIVCEKDGESHMYTLFNDAARQYNYHFIDETVYELADIEKRCGKIISIEKNFSKSWIDMGFLIEGLQEKSQIGEQDV
jgi:hypothetical protein